MENIIRYLKKVALENYVFSLAISIVVIIMSLVLSLSTVFGKALFVLGVIWFIVFFILYLKKVTKINQFFKEETDHIDDYKTVDTSVFTDQVIYAYSLDQFVKMNYDDIVSVNHVANIWEKTRPGYKGNHKIILKDSTNTIQIRVENEEIANIIMNFIFTKNNRVTLMHAPKKTEDIHLSDLDGWQVSGRF